MDRGPPLPVSVSVRVAVREPVAKGVKVRVMVQMLLAARLLPAQLSVSEKSPGSVPASAIVLMVTASVPRLIRFTVTELLAALSNWFPNETVVCENWSSEVAARLVPLSATFCGLPGALSVMLSEPENVPVVVGLKYT